MATDKKVRELKEISDAKSTATGFFFTEYHGIESNEMNDLKRAVRGKNAAFTIVKNTLVKKVFPEITLEGPSAMLVTYDEPVEALKLMQDFRKRTKLADYKLGYFQSEVLTKSQIETLAALPSKEVLVAQVLGLLQSPIQSFVSLGSNLQRSLVIALSEVANKKG